MLRLDAEPTSTSSRPNSVSSTRSSWPVGNTTWRRIAFFLAGFDAGGTMAMRIALSHPSRFAGVLSLCGAFPTGRTPFGNLVGRSAVADLPGHRPRQSGVSRRAGLRGLAASSHGRPVDHVAAVSLRSRTDAADARRRRSLDHRADHPTAFRTDRVRSRVVAGKRVIRSSAR